MHRKVLVLIISLFFTTPLLLINLSEKAWADKKSEQAEAQLKKAARYYNQKKFARAEKAFQEVIQMQVPLNDAFYYHYARVQLKNNKPEEALDSLNTYLQRAGKNGRFFKKANSLVAKLDKITQPKKNKNRATTDNKNNSRKQNKKKRNNSKSASALAIGTPQMVTIKKGRFTMGAKWGDEDQKPPFNMKIKHNFAISKNEISFAEYDRFAKETGRKLPDDKGWGRGNRPVINVSFYDAVAYAQWLSDKNQRRYRLPTEAEWEYVAKAKPGKKDKTYGHKNLIGRGDANCDGGRYFWESAKTKEVGSYEPNPAGVHDIFGNVWEWTCSIYTRKYDGNEDHCYPQDKLSGKTIAVRGGSWRSHSRTLRPYIRYNNYPTFSNDDLGFRIVEVLD